MVEENESSNDKKILQLTSAWVWSGQINIHSHDGTVLKVCIMTTIPYSGTLDIFEYFLPLWRGFINHSFPFHCVVCGKPDGSSLAFSTANLLSKVGRRIIPGLAAPSLWTMFRCSPYFSRRVERTECRGTLGSGCWPRSPIRFLSTWRVRKIR